MALAVGGLSALEIAGLAAVLLPTLPVAVRLPVIAIAVIPLAWLSLLFVNSLIAAALVLTRDPLASTSPGLRDGVALDGRVALAMAIRHEDFARVLARLIAMRESLDATGQGGAFDIAILSDSTDAAAIADEEHLFGAYRARLDGAGRALYRRRATNEGYKAGNIREFVTGAGADYAYMICLDADSVMDGNTMLAHARTMAAHPRLGLLQSLILPAAGHSAFSRFLRFSAETSVRTHYLGHAWWQADAGPFGGHNAILRVAAFRAHCHVPTVDAPPPIGGAVLGHDHVEAAMLRAGGYEVRLLPDFCGSWEDYPTDMLEFSGRNSRWALGNLQYPYLARRLDLLPSGRFHLWHLYAWFLVPPLGVATVGAAVIAGGWAWFSAMLALAVMPKLVGYLDIARWRGVRRYGGAGRFALSAALDCLVTVCTAPAVLVGDALAVARAYLGLSSKGWAGQARDGTRITASDALRVLWPSSLAGLALMAAQPPVALWPVVGGLLLSPLLAQAGGSTRLGAWLRRRGVFLIAAETAPDPILRRVREIERGR